MMTIHENFYNDSYVTKIESTKRVDNTACKRQSVFACGHQEPTSHNSSIVKLNIAIHMTL